MVKKLTLLITCLIMAIVFKSDAQSILSESFDGTTFPPTGWTKINTTPTWARYTLTSYPSGYSPHSGAGMMGFNSFSVSSGVSDMITPSMDFTTTTGNKEVSVWVFRDNGYLSYNEGIRVYMNTTASVTGATLLGTINRAYNMPPIETVGNLWYQYTLSIPSSFSGTTNYLIIEGFSGYGNDVYVDDVNVYNYIPCSSPTGIAASNMTSTSCTLSWTAVAGSLGYEYVIDQTAGTPTGTPTAISATTFNKTGLTPNTTYYLHLRNRCTSGTIPGSTSPWVDYAFTTNPPCFAPAGFNVTNLTPISATANWNAYPSALNYDIIVDQIYGTPVSTTGLVNTPLTSMPLTALTENTKYYVHLRSHCAGNEVSSWSLDSFTTPLVCRAPQITISSISTDEAVASWDPIPSSTAYEYAITTSPTPPGNGTNYLFTSVHMSALFDGKTYYIHVRSLCNSVGIVSESDWATASFATFPTGVNTITHNGFSLNVYPNPVKDMMTINLSGVTGTAVMELADMSGRVVRTISNTASGKAQLDMSGLTPGIYILKYTDIARHETVKITKQ